ncbi:hypothetical protein HPP92_028018 [Vanilla planifolia]|uniref:Lipoyl-binding domain-containing protein n=1 Tax=Vanilla planifolia TaxID=51239 RepID=A0A835P732_VANPL|nr:hypothetical protein HPP92_028018 [Vanilla planifolia]
MELKITQLSRFKFIVEAAGLSIIVTLARYLKDNIHHIHIWHGQHHHQFKQPLTLYHSNDDAYENKPKFEMPSRTKGGVLAPMAGLVVKVLVENGAKVEEGQPILVLEAMKMEGWLY